MSASVLIVSPDPAFAELLRLTLEEQNQRASVRVSSGAEAIRRAEEQPLALAILDADIEDMTLRDLGSALRARQPNLPLILISASPEEEALETLQPEALLSKPFYLPDLEALLHQVLTPEVSRHDESATAPRPTQPPPPWLANVSVAAQHLTRLSLESAAQAAMITHGDRLWAYAGQLPQPAAEELADHVIALWARDGSSQTDLVRFVRLESTEAEYLLYVTSLTGDMVLALAFEADTPFSQIRTQASKLARALSSPPESAAPEVEASVPADDTLADEDDLLLDDEWDPLSDDELADVPPLFDDVPPPVPTDWIAEVPSNGDMGREELLQALAAPQAETQTEVQTEAQTEAPGADKTASLPDQDTRPSPLGAVGRLPQPAPPPERYALRYNTLLIPRLPAHHLIGDLARNLNTWVRQLCLAYGWRLEGLQIRPDYLLLSLDAPPSMAPGVLVRILRRHTSQLIFEHHPDLRDENPSGAFWAPGYLITGGHILPSPSLIRDFIRNLRRRQGIRP